MNKDTRTAIERATQRARKLLEEDFAAQLEGNFDVHRNGTVAGKAGDHLSPRQAFQRECIIAAIEHKHAAGMSHTDAARDYLRDAAFTTLNRFVALKMLEARELVQECITKGEQSAGYLEFCGMAPGLPLLPDNAGYRLYIESLFDEMSTEVKVLFDRRDPSSVLWPKRATFEQLLEILNAPELAPVWGEDETIGWVYQFFNREEDRKAARYDEHGKSKAPQNSRELAVRNQFFTPRYVVQFLTDNTLGRIWYEMCGTKTVLIEKCAYMVHKPGEKFAPRVKKDPRDLHVLDPACGSGHFLLYTFDLLLTIYEEAYADPQSPKSEASGKTLSEDYRSLEALRTAIPGLILAHNLHGVDIDPRCAQIAQLALWMRAQKAYRDFGISRAERAQIRRSNIVVAEPLVADDQIVKDFVAKLGDAELGRVFTSLVETLNLAGDMGLLLRFEKLVKGTRKQGELFAPSEERIRAALDRFVHEEESATTTRSRLFADDATHGVALLGVAEKMFDVVLMNPPYGRTTDKSKQILSRAYPQHWLDVYLCFLARGIELARAGRVGALVSRTWMFLSKFERARRSFVDLEQIAQLIDLGPGVLDEATVETCALVLVPAGGVHEFFSARAVSPTAREQLLTEIAGGALGSAIGKFSVTSLFSRTPGGAIIFEDTDPAEAAEEVCRPFTAKPGIQTSDDFRFVRAWWEVHPSTLGRSGWARAIFGSQDSHYYSDHPMRLKWFDEGREVAAYIEMTQGAASRGIRNRDAYFSPGLCYQYTGASFRVHPLPPDAIISVAGQGLYPHDGADAFALLALLNTRVAAQRLKEINPGRFFQATYVNALSFRREEWCRHESHLSHVGRKLCEHQMEVFESKETSLIFDPETMLQAGENRTRRSAEELTRLCHEAEELAALVLGRVASEPPILDRLLQFERPSEQSLVSFLVGVTFGRWRWPQTAVLPVESSSEVFDVEGGQPEQGPVKNIYVDDEGHADDLVTETWERMIAAPEMKERLLQLGSSAALRDVLQKEFFAEHIVRYTSGRRRSPIFWQLSTPSARYSVWLYIHAFSKDTLFRVQNDYAAPKLAHEERRLESLSNHLRDGATAVQRKDFATQEGFVEELRFFLEEVKRVAPLWNPSLDDGVIINFAPLWRLVPQHKAWQKELKATWDEVFEEKYEWTHLAMHLWPERVVPKCAKDRSLAIAHGLEDVFWVEGTNGKCTARKTPTRSIDGLVHDRTSPAVKSALKSLLEAPAVVGTGRKTKREKANA